MEEAVAVCKKYPRSKPVALDVTNQVDDVVIAVKNMSYVYV